MPKRGPVPSRALPVKRTPAADTHRVTLERGAAMQLRGDFIGAERAYQTVLRDEPENPLALNLLGTLAIEAKRLDVAENLFRRALGHEPHNMTFLGNLGSVLVHQKLHAAAVEVLEKVVAAAPRQQDALVNLALTYRALNRPEDAKSAFERALRLAPGNEKAELGRAELLVDLGETDAATSRFRVLIAKKRSVPQALTALSVAHKFNLDDPEPALMEAELANPKLPDGARINLLHALGKARADLKQYDAAFAALSAAKRLSGNGFDLGQTEAYYTAMQAKLTPEFFAARSGFGLPTEAPVFVVGMPRSGTTLTEQIASSHSEVTGVGEVPSMSHIARRLGWRKSSPEQLIATLEKLTAEDTRHLAEAYLVDIAHYGPPARRIIDKVPHNFEFLGLIALMFPNARIIHCRRDPIDTCVSCFTHSFNEAHGYNADLQVLGRYYRAHERLMAHWREVLPLWMFENSYEQLVAEPEAQSRALIAFLGLEWEDACLDFQSNERLVLTPSRWQVRQQIYTSSVKSWAKYETHLGPLFEALGDLADTAPGVAVD